MKSEYYLRSVGLINILPKWFEWLWMAVITALTIYMGKWMAVYLFFLPCVGILILRRLFEKIARGNGLYIKGNKIWIKGSFSKKNVLPREIAGIKIMQLHYMVSGPPDSYIPMHYEGGGIPIYMMILLSEISPYMYNYKNNDRVFMQIFNEEVITEAEYDPEAVKYLKTLNPDIKVFY